MRCPELPEPWEEVEQLPTEQADALEAVAGCKMTYADMTDDDVNRTGDGGVTPKSLRAFYVMGHQWVRLRNRDTGDDMLVRLQFKESHEVYVSAVISPFRDGRETTGVQMRALPTSAISAAYTARNIGGAVNLNRALVLGDALKDDPLQPLPNGRVTDQAFLARVGLQYDAIGEQYPDGNSVSLMAELNGVALPTVKKWLAAARKALFLMPVASGRKRG